MADEDIRIELSNIQKSTVNIDLLMKVRSISSDKKNYLNDIRRISQSSSDSDPKKIADRGYDILRYYRLANGRKIIRKF